MLNRFWRDRVSSMPVLAFNYEQLREEAEGKGQLKPRAGISTPQSDLTLEEKIHRSARTFMRAYDPDGPLFDSFSDALEAAREKYGVADWQREEGSWK